jgi:RNA polymerase sigma factor (sigma-70 family)
MVAREGSRDPADVERALVEAHRREWAVVLAATAYSLRDIDLAEECVQEAYASALVAWRRDGIPNNPAAWLTTTAKRRAVDAVRRESTLRLKMPLLVESETVDDDSENGGAISFDEEFAVPDERLRLVFLCCHPSLAPEAQMALTLRMVCGMSTADIARAFLVPEATMAARMTRAKHKIAAARIPLRVPAASELPDRLSTVLGVIYLLFTMGHTAPSGTSLVRNELSDEALHLTRVLQDLMPDEREVRGLLALLLVTDARRTTRVDSQMRPLRLEEQDRSQWDQIAIDQAHALIEDGLRVGQPGRYVLQAAIALEHAQASSYDATDWPLILRYYDQLLEAWPSPVIALNRSVALSMVAGPEKALAQVEVLDIDGHLANYHYLPVVKADLLRRLGRMDEARRESERAIHLTQNESEREYLVAQLRALPLGE